jgi:hypothetical protein
MITPKQALDWHVFKAEGGPTYAGSTDGSLHRLPHLEDAGVRRCRSRHVEIYDRYIVEDWPDRRTHVHDSPNAVEKLVTNGTPVLSSPHAA